MENHFWLCACIDMTTVSQILPNNHVEGLQGVLCLEIGYLIGWSTDTVAV